MQIKQIVTNSFLGLSRVDFECPADYGLNGFTGSNGSGKTALLRLINTSIARLGLGSDYQSGLAREWIASEYDFSVTLDFEDEDLEWIKSEIVNLPHQYGSLTPDQILGWDGTASINLDFNEARSASPYETLVSFGTMSGHFGTEFGNKLAQVYDNSGQLKLGFIDANRAYTGDSQRSLHHSELITAGDFQVLKNAASINSLNAYHQGLDYWALLEGRSLSRAKGRARALDLADDLLEGYSDPLDELRRFVKQVMPTADIDHVDPTERMLYLRKGSHLIPFSHLSGGEREVIFIATQLIRLKVNRGVLLIDEPELHLNPELLRRLMIAIKLIASDVQVFVATHSYEAIESVGINRTYLLEGAGREETEITKLSTRPVLITLANELGAVGFSIANKILVLIEGAATSVREIPRFEMITGLDERYRFSRTGHSKKDVLERIDVLNAFATEEPEHVHVKAIIDSDFESLEQMGHTYPPNVHRILAHEVENLFLEPGALAAAIEPIEKLYEEDVVKLLRDIVAKRAGEWVWGRMEYLYNSEWKEANILAEIEESRRTVKRMDEANLLTEQQSIKTLLLEINPCLGSQFEESMKTYRRMKSRRDFWLHCMGKETLSDFALHFSWNDEGERLEGLVIKVWDTGKVKCPQAVLSIRAFLSA